jgi:hypothetical protein
LASNLTLTSPVAIYPGKFGSPTQDNIYFDDGLGARYLTNSSNNSFVLNATLTSTDANVSPVISDDFISVNVINNYINNMGISNNVISIVNGGVGYNVTNVAVTCSSPDIGTDQAFFNCNLDANGTITNVNCYYHGSGYVTTPTLYVTGGNTSQATITVTGESNAKGGNAYTRYFTKPVVLAPGNDSGDLRVFYTAYKPYGSSVYVYYRILNSNDTSKLDDQKWQLMTQISGINNYSTSRTDFIEFECAPGLFLSGQANNNIAYTSTNGQSYNTFIQFEVKIVLATSDPTKVPVLSDMRAIALPSGTGL